MSTLKADTIQSTSGGAATLTKQQAIKAYVSYDATTNAVDDTFNRSSTTDNAAGDATHAWTSAAAAATYTFGLTGTTDDSGNAGYGYTYVSSGTATRGYRTTSSHRLATGYGGSASLADFDIYAYFFLGDLA
jgi:hypothetical protein